MSWQEDVEKRLAALEAKVLKPVRLCKVCGFDMVRPWICETKGCPRLVELRGYCK